MSNKAKTTGVALSAQLKKAAKAAAKAEQRSFSGYIRALIERDLTQRRAA